MNRAAMAAKAIESVDAHGEYVDGPEVLAFETALAEAIGRPFAVGCNSGYGALVSSFLALGITNGWTVVCGPGVAPAAVALVLRNHATPLCLDLDSDFERGLLDERIETPEKSILLLSMDLIWPEEDDFASWTSAGRNVIIDVTAHLGQAIAEEQPLPRTATLVACLRSAPGFLCPGDAGVIVPVDKWLADRLLGIRPEIRHWEDYGRLPGGNFQMDSLQGVFAREGVVQVATASRARPLSPRTAAADLPFLERFSSGPLKRIRSVLESRGV